MDKNEMLLYQSANHVEVILKTLLAEQNDGPAWRYLLAWLDLVSPNQAAQCRMADNAGRAAFLMHIANYELLVLYDESALSRDDVYDQLVNHFTPGSKLPELDWVKLSFAERINSLGGDLLSYLVGKKYTVIDWPKTVNDTLELLTDVLNVLPAGAQRPKWCTELHYEVAHRYANVVRRLSPPRVKPQLPKMHAIQSLLNEYYRILPTLQEGVNEMSNGSELNDIHFAKPLPEGFANMSEILKDPEVHTDTFVQHVTPPADLRKDPAYQLNINGCGRVAFRCKGSRLGWMNQISAYIDIVCDDTSLKSDVLDVLGSIEFMPFENHSSYELDAAAAELQLEEFMEEIRSTDVLERPMFSSDACFISIIPTVRQSWATDGHGNPV